MSTITFDNLALVANAIDLAVEITANVSGAAVSNHLNGTPINDRTVAAIAATEINNVIEGRENA